MSDSFQPHGLQHTRLPCPSLSPKVCSNSCPLGWWCHPTVSSSVTVFSSCPQSFPASESFPTSQLFTWGGQSIGASASASVLPMNIQGWFPLGLTGWISLLSKGGASGKELTCQTGDLRDMGFIPRWERSPEEEMAAHSNILAWKVPWTEEPGGLQSMGLQKVGHNWSDLAHIYIYPCWLSIWNIVVLHVNPKLPLPPILSPLAAIRELDHLWWERTEGLATAW